ncbi:MAG: hypothetical protein NDF56_07705 [archaeon GB-1845-036]|nr:hypothetical protein [Candidatus Culexmicrobium thermophilum]
MAISRSDWEKLTELWDISEIASTVSRILASLYMLKMGVHKPEISTKLLLEIEKCRKLLRKIIEDLELHAHDKAPETILVTLLINAYGQIDTRKIENNLLSANQGLSKLEKIIKQKTINEDRLKDKDILQLENMLRKLSDALNSKAAQIASEIYAV